MRQSVVQTAGHQLRTIETESANISVRDQLSTAHIDCLRLVKIFTCLLTYVSM